MQKPTPTTDRRCDTCNAGGVDLFGTPCVKVAVRRYNGERMDVANFGLDDKVDIPEELK